MNYYFGVCEICGKNRGGKISHKKCSRILQQRNKELNTNLEKERIEKDKKQGRVYAGEDKT